MDLATWVPMMAAMMLPAAAPAVASRVRAGERIRAMLLFVGSYLAVWTLVATVVYALRPPPESLTAGAVVIAAGFYEFTPLKEHFRRRCRDSTCSGLEFGLYCAGSCIGLMLMFAAIGATSAIWMAALAVLVLAQKIVPAKAIIDAPLALAIVGLGILIVVAPSWLPGLTPSPMCGPSN